MATPSTEGKPIDVPLQRRGDPGQSRRPVVPRGVPRFAFLDGEPPPPLASGSSGRLELARWLTQPGNPLDGPGHGQPDLAAPLRPGDRRHAVQLRAPRRAADPSRAARLARGPIRRRRLVDQGDPSRDPALADLSALERPRRAATPRSTPTIAGSGGFPAAGSMPNRSATPCWPSPATLDEAGPGRHPFPPIEAWHWTQHDAFKAVYPSNHRSVYLMTQRLVKHPFLAIFDGPDTNVSTDVRGRFDRPAPGALPPEQSVRAGTGSRSRRPPDRRRSRDPTHRIEPGLTNWPGRAARRPDERRSRLRVPASGMPHGASAGAPRGISTSAKPGPSLAKVLLTANEFLYID